MARRVLVEQAVPLPSFTPQTFCGQLAHALLCLFSLLTAALGAMPSLEKQVGGLPSLSPSVNALA